jgi:predicted nucleic acid-binding protein
VTFFVDSNILIDVMAGAEPYAGASARALAQALAAGTVLIDPIVYAEIAPQAGSQERLDAFLSDLKIEIAPTPRVALFLASRAFLAYRARGGVRTGVLPDFLIAAHASVAQAPLLTRDMARHRFYFPDLALVTP